MNPKQFRNPFYVLLLIVGILFLITTCAYAVMAARGVSPASQDGSASGEQLMTFLDEHGFTVMMVEIALLGVTTFAAMATDRFWMRRFAAEEEQGTTDSTDRS